MTRDVSDVMHQKRGLRFEKRNRDLGAAIRICALRAPCVLGVDGNVITERLCLSLPYVERPFNSKAIKSFVPELRSHKCFSCFGIPMLYI